ncbi:MAG TPA: hypothetical protein DCF82_05695 [Marinobacter hydrocarbonoclasticus]|jgi:hypothetical protein|uniref:Uncharacterized protein n=1 Tax=Marinobacter nauticus TaxID=2743 RepID=A0A3B8WC71_MARNT|nr:hypothetical protein [Marinobacter nauticus]
MPHIVSQQGRWVNVFIKVDDATTHHFLVREAHFDDDMITLKFSQDESDDDPVFRSYFRESYIGYGYRIIPEESDELVEATKISIMDAESAPALPSVRRN